MPIQRGRYPSDWDKISLARREQAGWKCEWCGIAQGTEVLGSKGKPYKIVLTVAHLGPNRDDKMDCSNIAALCQRCHLRYDHADHIAHAAETRRRKRLALQPELSF